LTAHRIALEDAEVIDEEFKVHGLGGGFEK
jgi:hypothetical protein